MPTVRIVVHDIFTGAEVTVASVYSFGEAVVVARAVRHGVPWLVVETNPAVWLSARSVTELADALDEPAMGSVVRRYYLLARDQLAALGASETSVNEQLPLTNQGFVPRGA